MGKNGLSRIISLNAVKDVIDVFEREGRITVVEFGVTYYWLSAKI